MKTTYKEIIGAKNALGKLLDKQLRVKEAIALARLVKALNEELELFGQEQRRILAGAKQVSEDGTTSPVSGEGKETSGLPEDVVRKLQELLDVEVEIDAEPVTVTVDEIDAGTLLATEAFVIIKEAGD